MGRAQGTAEAVALQRRNAAGEAVDIIPIGPPGAGKSTQGKLVAAQLGIGHISTGQIFRDSAAVQDAAAVAESGDPEAVGQITQMFRTGQLFPDEMLYPLIRDALTSENARRGLIIDGFPRTVAQAEEMRRICSELGRKEPVAVEFELSDEVAVERLLGRSEGRVDDDPETIVARQREYQQKTSPLLDYYRSRGALLSVNADAAVDEVSSALAALLAPIYT